MIDFGGSHNNGISLFFTLSLLHIVDVYCLGGEINIEDSRQSLFSLLLEIYELWIPVLGVDEF